MTKASIITIGDELLIGQVVDTNSAWIAQLLNKSGIPVLRRVAVGDVYEEIWSALDEESAKADIIIITGGLGPTADDITKPLLCNYFEGKMILNEEALQQVTYLFENVFKRPVTPRNRKQAEIPDTCTMLLNTRGTAPGMWFEKNGKVFVSLPGVPHEMKGLMEEKVMPRLRSQFKLSYITHRTLITFGIGESMLADKIQEFEEALPHYIKLAYLPNYGIVRLRLTAKGSHKETINQEIEQQVKTLMPLINEYLIHTEDEPMEKIVANLLTKIQKSVSTAESCTGGYIAHLLTSMSGSSAYYKGSVVAYSNELKEKMLDVPHKVLQEHGAVSEAVVQLMASGLLTRSGTDYAIAVSGIMGPEGGSAEKPVGTVWMAVGSRNKILSRKFHFRQDRSKNIQLTAMNALNLLREFIVQDS